MLLPQGAEAPRHAGGGRRLAGRDRGGRSHLRRPAPPFAANRGKGFALLKGFELLSDYDAVVTLDADAQHPPECFPAFVAAAEAGADLVLGARPRSPNMPGLRRFRNALSSGWTSALAGRTVPQPVRLPALRPPGDPRTPMTTGR
jgi:glycosyltransferase involved in cell wall biosynthesis